MRPLVKVLITILLISFGCNSSTIITSTEPSLEEMKAGFQNPEMKYHPETWFHINGNNISKEGLTLDLEAISYAGLQGIHLFNKNGRPYPGVEQIKILSPEWEELIRHAAEECQRLGLKFTMQNCPGWSMTGGPWVPVEEAQREIVESVFQMDGGNEINTELTLRAEYLKPDYNYKDIRVLAFPTPEGDDTETHIPARVISNNNLIPWKAIFDPAVELDLTSKEIPEHLKMYAEKGIAKINGEDTWVKVNFTDQVTIRSVKMSPIRNMILDRQYPVVDVKLKIQALQNGILKDVTILKIPDANWSDRQLFTTLAIPETTSDEFILSFAGEHSLLPADILLSSKPRLHNHEAKAARALRSLEKEIKIDVSEDCIINPDQIINLTEKMDNTGHLTWDAPEGDWTIIRFGHVNMRRTNKPAVPEATGWECSKLDKVAIENHLRNGMIGQMIKDGGPIGDGKLAGLLIDSWESYIPTWTIHAEDMFREFEQRRGYDMMEFLPATMGYIVKSQDVTTRFLRDLRQTMDEVYIDNFFAHFASVAHDMGAEVYTEGAGGEVLPIDPMRYYGVSDIPMTEFWYPKAPSSQNEYAKPIFPAASATHLYNKPVLAAEACTQLNVKWNEHPYAVKYLIDYNFTKGVNHLVFHTFSHSPQKKAYPGSSFGGNIGFPFVRQQTWWKYMPDWVDYLSRCQYILQQGEYVADVLWYYGDHFERPPFDLDYFPDGYRFDYLNAEILHQKLSVSDGKINVEGAGDYRIIFLRDSDQMLLSTAQRLKELVSQGAVILGDKPVKSPSLMDDEEDEKELRKIADELWGESPGGFNQFGKGRVYWGKSLMEVLNSENIPPDVIVANELPLSWIHRKTDEADIYFISSTCPDPLDLSISFKLENTYPEIWDPFTGAQSLARVWSKDKERINVSVSFAPSGSAILVFPKGKKEPEYTKVEFNEHTILDTKTSWYRMHHNPDSIPTLVLTENAVLASQSGIYSFTKEDKTIEKQMLDVHEKLLNDNWILRFEEGWDAPSSYNMLMIKPLTEIKDKAIRHYSGTVTYTKEISYTKNDKQVYIDLGNVANIADFWCNGEKIGVRWAPPFTFDLTGKLKEGKNLLEIKVTNTWRNQLIYDNSRTEAEKKTWTTNPPRKDEKELELSGLSGPVRLITY